jgi:hypothetical protein
MISARTKAALGAAKARGVRLGGRRPGLRNVDPMLGMVARIQVSNDFAVAMGPVIAELRQAGMSLYRIVTELQRRGIRTMHGGAWTATTVLNALRRYEGAGR